jgi:hypothetical protein
VISDAMGCCAEVAEGRSRAVVKISILSRGGIAAPIDRMIQAPRPGILARRKDGCAWRAGNSGWASAYTQITTCSKAVALVRGWLRVLINLPVAKLTLACRFSHGLSIWDTLA